MYKFYYFSLFILISVTLNAQSLFIPENHNGTKVSFSHGFSDDASSYGIGIGYSPNGLINFSGGLSKTDFESGDLTSNNISGHISYLLLKNTEKRIMALSASAGISYSKYDGTFVQTDDVDMNKLDYVFGTAVSFTINVFDVFELIPVGELKYFIRTIKASNTEDSHTSKVKKFYATTGANIVVDVGNDYKIILSPMVTFIESHTSYNVSLAFNLQDFI